MRVSDGDVPVHKKQRRYEEERDETEESEEKGGEAGYRERRSWVKHIGSYISEQSHTVEKCPHPNFFSTMYLLLNFSPILTG